MATGVRGVDATARTLIRPIVPFCTEQSPAGNRSFDLGTTWVPHRPRQQRNMTFILENDLFNSNYSNEDHPGISFCDLRHEVPVRAWYGTPGKVSPVGWPGVAAHPRQGARSWCPGFARTSPGQLREAIRHLEIFKIRINCFIGGCRKFVFDQTAIGITIKCCAIPN